MSSILICLAGNFLRNKEFRDVTGLDGQLYDLLRQFPRLMELNLSDNQLRELPRDLSGLINLTNLNLNGN